MYCGTIERSVHVEFEVLCIIITMNLLTEMVV